MRIFHVKTIVSSIVCLVVVASCGGSNQSSGDANSEQPNQVATSEPSGSSSSLENVAEEYASLVRPTNCALTKYTELESSYDIGNAQLDPAGIADLTSAVGRIAEERQKAVEELVGRAWPDVVADDMEALALYWAGIQRKEVAVSEANDLGTWNQAVAAWRDTSQSSESGRSKIIRIKLGLGDFSPSECD